MRNAIDLLNDSRQSDGCTMSRYPTRTGAVHSRASRCGGSAWCTTTSGMWTTRAFVKRMLPGVRSVLSFFAGYQKENGSLGSLPWWRYFDWVPGVAQRRRAAGGRWRRGAVRPATADGLPVGGGAGEGARHRRTGGRVRRARTAVARRRCARSTGMAGRKLFADTPAKQKFSQHTNTLAVLADVVEGTRRAN